MKCRKSGTIARHQIEEGKKEGGRTGGGGLLWLSDRPFLLPSFGGAVVGGSVRCTQREEEALISCVALFLVSFFVAASLVLSSPPRKFVF